MRRCLIFPVVLAAALSCRAETPLHAAPELVVQAASSRSIVVLALCGDGRALFSGHEDGQIKRWNVTTGEIETHFPTLPRRVTGLAVTPDGKTLAASDGVALRLFDARTGKVARMVEIEGYDWSQPTRTITFRAAGRIIGYVGGNRYQERLTTTLQPHGRPRNVGDLADLVFSADGAQFAAVSDGKIVWGDNATGQTRYSFALGKHDFVHGLRFCGDGTTVAASIQGSDLKNGALHFWETQSGRLWAVRPVVEVANAARPIVSGDLERGNGPHRKTNGVARRHRTRRLFARWQPTHHDQMGSNSFRFPDRRPMEAMAGTTEMATERF